MIKTLSNRHQQKIVIEVKNKTGKAGLAFIAHGLSGHRKQAHIQVYAAAFLEADYCVVLWDVTNSLGESGGELIDATLTGYYQDMEDVIAWAESQFWYQEPFVIAGHSLGGACNILYAVEHPEKIKALAPTSAFLSGKINLESLGKEAIEDWRQKGVREVPRESQPGKTKKYGWALAEDTIKYELFDHAKEIRVPVLLIVGSKDKSTPPFSQEKFFDNLPTKDKELHIVEGSRHTFIEMEHLTAIKRIFQDWLKKIR